MSLLLMETILLNLARGTAAFAMNWLLQSTLLIGAGLLFARLLARRGSAAQSVVFCTTLVAVLVCPPLTWALSQFGVTGWSPVVWSSTTEEESASSANQPVEMVVPVLEKPVARHPRVVTDRSELTATPPQVIASKIDQATAADNAENAAVIPSAAPVLNQVAPQSEPTKPSTITWARIAGWSVWGWLSVAAGLAWVSISGWLLTRLAVAWWRLMAIRRGAVPAETSAIHICGDLSARLGVSAPALLHTPFLPSPCLAGLLDPAVLLPDSDQSVSIRDVLIHELAHLRRRDAHWNLLRKLATGLFWFQPLLWVLSRKIEMAAEEVCDDFVVEFGVDRAEYAHRLVDVAEFSAVPMATAAVAFVSLRSMLAQRVSRILDTSRRLSTGTSRKLFAAAWAGGCVSTLIIGFIGAAPPSSAVSADDSPDKNGNSAAIAADGVNGDAKATVIAEAPASRAASPAVAAGGPLPGIISSPPLLPGNRRWQMYTKNNAASATNVCWSPDGRWLAVAHGQLVRIFDFENGMPEFKIVLAGHTDTVNAVEFNAKGDRLATASLDGTVRLWSADGREQFVYRGHEDAVQDVSWHPDGAQLASASLDGTVRIWSDDGKTTAVMTSHEAPVNTVAWNPNGKLLASGCENKSIRYWSAEGAPGPVIEAHIGPVRSLAWNADGSQLLSCDFGIEASNDTESDRADMKIWDVEGKPVNSVHVTQPLSHVAWSPDGTQAVAGHWRSITLWNISANQSRSVFLTVNNGTAVNGIVPVAWRPSGDLIAAGPVIVDGMGNRQAMISVRDVSLNSAGLSPDGKVLGIGRAARRFDLYSSDGEHLFQSPELVPQSNFSLMHSICWSPDGKSFIPGMRGQTNLQRYDASGKQVGDAIVLPGDMRSVAWSKDGRYVAAGGDRQIISLADLDTGNAISLGKQGHGITQVRFTPDQKHVCSAGFDGCVRFWSLDGKPVNVLEAISAPIDSLAWSGDGNLLATGHQDNTIRFWNSDGELQTILGGHGGHVEALEFNPAGTLLASGGRDNSVRLWNRDGTPVAALQGHSGTVYGLQWTSDGHGLYSCSEDGTVRFWNTETGVTEWQALVGEGGGYVTIDAQGRVKHGDEKILESDFVFFAEDDQGRLVKTDWADLRAAVAAAPAKTAP